MCGSPVVQYMSSLVLQRVCNKCLAFDEMEDRGKQTALTVIRLVEDRSQTPRSSPSLFSASSHAKYIRITPLQLCANSLSIERRCSTYMGTWNSRDTSPKAFVHPPTMPGFLAFISAPALLLLSIPLATFAVVTTALAFWTLLFRVSIVYVELFLALLRAYITPAQPSVIELPPLSPIKERAIHKRRANSSASSLGGTETPKNPPTKSESFASLVGTGQNRDFEGVGGWRVSGNEEEEALWMSMNSRLELPAAPARRHERSFTGGSQRFTFASPEVGRSPGLMLKTPGGKHWQRHSMSGTASPEGYFSVPVSGGSMTALNGDRNSRVSFEERRKSSSNSSTASLNSVGRMSRRNG